VIEQLQWDSKHFGCAVARVKEPETADRIAAAVEAADRDGVRCLTALIDAGQTAALTRAEELGFRCYDVRIELDRPVATESPGEEDVHPASADDMDRLEPISRTSFTDSRFYADPNFPDELAGELYVIWLRRGLAENDRLLLTTPEREGFVLCHLDGETRQGTIELIAVAPGREGTGIGDRLVRGADLAYARAGMTLARVVTQGRNIPAQRLYQRHGYRTRGVGYWLHRWR
jgi:dTDP-4-amino-4,6-dideoxy-D-galactose acyltransferase